MNCKHCDILKQKEAEVAELQKEQDLLFLLLESGLIAVEQWTRDNGLLPGAGNRQKMVHVTGKNDESSCDREKLTEQIRALLKDQLSVQDLAQQHDPKEHKPNPRGESLKK